MACPCCAYAGKAKDLFYHVGKVHGKLKDHLPAQVWEALLFGQQGSNFEPAISVKRKRSANKARARASAAKRRRLKKATTMQARAQESLGFTAAAAAERSEQSSSKLPSLGTDDPADVSDPTWQGKDDGNSTHHCRLCEFSARGGDTSFEAALPHPLPDGDAREVLSRRAAGIFQEEKNWPTTGAVPGLHQKLQSHQLDLPSLALSRRGKGVLGCGGLARAETCPAFGQPPGL